MRGIVLLFLEFGMRPEAGSQSPGQGWPSSRQINRVSLSTLVVSSSGSAASQFGDAAVEVLAHLAGHGGKQALAIGRQPPVEAAYRVGAHPAGDLRVARPAVDHILERGGVDPGGFQEAPVATAGERCTS